jgi:hypothetical protein
MVLFIFDDADYMLNVYGNVSTLCLQTNENFRSCMIKSLKFGGTTPEAKSSLGLWCVTTTIFQYSRPLMPTHITISQILLVVTATGTFHPFNRAPAACASVVIWMILIPQFVYVMQGSVLASRIMFTKVHNIKSLS